MKNFLKYSLFIIASILALGGECAKNIIDPPEKPVIEEMTLNPESPVNPGDTVTVTVIATNPEEGILDYSWSKTGGTLIHPLNNSEIKWKMPSVGGTYNITVKVTNQKEKSTSASREINVASLTEPFVNITYPNDGDYFVQYENIEIEVIAYHMSDLLEVKLFINNNLKRTISGHPSEEYSFDYELADSVGDTEIKVQAVSTNNIVGEDVVVIKVEGIIEGKK